MTEKKSAHGPAVAGTMESPETTATGTLATGTVRALLTEQEAMVTLASGEQIHAVQAAGCLLAPAIGDTVLVFNGPDQAFVLSVLARDMAVAAEIGVAGAKDVSLKAPGRLSVSAPDVHISSRRLNILAESVTQTGKQLINNFTRSLETFVDKIVNARTITTTAQSRSSSVKETETLKAGILVQNIDSVATQNSDISMITAEEDVRLDAKRVSVG